MEAPEPSVRPQSGLGRRKKHLAPIQTKFSPDPIAKFQRPPPIETVIYKASPDEGSTEPKLSRRASRSFLGLFARKPSATELRTQQTNVSPITETPTRAPPPPRTPSLPKKRTPKNDAESTPRKKEPSPRAAVTWDPPPLFQAYPQALRHATLSAPTVPAATVLRNQKKAEAAPRPLVVAEVPEDDPAVVRKAREPGAARVDCAAKVYVLATAGYLLQYAAAGAHDRRPERVLPLGPRSAAFASDALPGRHWVLQVNHASAADGSAARGPPAARGVFARLAARGPGGGGRRRVSCFLLIMPDAEEMDRWLVAIRTEIQHRGGPAYRPDVTADRRPADALLRLQSRPSRRYVIKPDRAGAGAGAGEPGPRAATPTGPGGPDPLRPRASTASLDSDAAPHATPELTHASTPTAESVASRRASRVLDAAPRKASADHASLDSAPAGGRPLSFAASAAPHQPGEAHAAEVPPNFSVPFGSHRFSQSYHRPASLVLSTPAMSAGSASPVDDEAARPGSRLSALPVLPTHAAHTTHPTHTVSHAPQRAPPPGPLALFPPRATSSAAAAARDAHGPLPAIVPVTPDRAEHPHRLSSLDHAYGLLPFALPDEEPPPPAPAPTPLDRRHSALEPSPRAPAPLAPLPPLPGDEPPAQAAAEASGDATSHAAGGPPRRALPPPPGPEPASIHAPYRPPALRRPASVLVRPEASTAGVLLRPRTASRAAALAAGAASGGPDAPGAPAAGDPKRRERRNSEGRRGDRSDGERRKSDRPDGEGRRGSGGEARRSERKGGGVRTSVHGPPAAPPPRAPLPEIPGLGRVAVA